MAPRRKLTGAQARLFASICLHYMGAAEDGCNDKPEEVPVFSHLTKAHRLRLVREVMIGVLCAGEPLPPNTIQHNATYHALIETLFCELTVESDTQYDSEEVGEDLLRFDEPSCGQPRTPEEIEEYNLERDLVEYRARKNWKRMLRKGDGVGEFHVEEDLFKPNENETSRILHEVHKHIFSGGPVAKEERDTIRPLNEDEEDAFHWRRLCDAALQQDRTNSPFSLCLVNFDWRCQKFSKWFQALELLLVNKMMSYGSPTERALISGRVESTSYADPDQLPRILSLEKHIDVLRKVFAPSWDQQKLAIDQRCIFAICSIDIFLGQHHKKWLVGFLTECERRGIDIRKGSNYQQRLDIFRKTKDDFAEGCDLPFGCRCPCPDSERKRIIQNWDPGNEEPVKFFEKTRCHGPGKSEETVVIEGHQLKFPGSGWCFKTENLRACSVCNTVKYCSAECQRLDWPKHKKHCARLAAERKDKEKIARMAKAF